MKIKAEAVLILGRISSEQESARENGKLAGDGENGEMADREGGMASISILSELKMGLDAEPAEVLATRGEVAVEAVMERPYAPEH